MLFIASIIPNLIAAFSKIATTLGPMIAKYVPIMLETLGKNLPKVAQIVESISIATNVLHPNERTEELGAKAMAANKKPEDFDQLNDYLDYLRKDVEIDNEQLSQDPIDSAIRLAIGTSIVIKSLNQELGINLSLPFLNTVSRLDLDPKLILAIANAYTQSDLNADELGRYFSDKLNISQAQQHSEALTQAFQSANPILDREQAEDAVMDLRWRAENA